MCDAIEGWTPDRRILFWQRLIATPLALILNSLCIFLIVYKAKILLRNYKYLLISLCIIDLLFTLFYFLTALTPMLRKEGVYLLNCGLFEQIPEVNQAIIHTLFCLVAVSGYTLTVLFIYRWAHFCATHYLYIFHSRGFWLAVGGLMTVMVFVAEKIASALTGQIEQHSTTVIYIAFRHQKVVADQDPASAFKAEVATYICVAAISVSLLIILYCSCRILYDIRNVPMGERSRVVQIHLFKALLIQTSVPILLCYIPFVLVLFSPHFGETFQRTASTALLLAAWYPVLAPVLLMYFVVDYRRVLQGCLSFFVKRVARVRAATYTENSY